MNQCGPTFEAERTAALRFSARKPTIFWNVDIPHRKCATNIFFWGYSSRKLGIFSKRWLVTWAFCQVNCLDLSSHLTLATWLQVSPKLGTQISKSTKYQFCSLLFKKMIHAHTFQDWHLLLKNTGLFSKKSQWFFSQVSLSQRKKSKDLEQRPRQCPQRYFYLATMGTALRLDEMRLISPIKKWWFNQQNSLLCGKVFGVQNLYFWLFFWDEHLIYQLFWCHQSTRVLTCGHIVREQEWTICCKWWGNDSNQNMLDDRDGEIEWANHSPNLKDSGVCCDISLTVRDS